MTPEDLKAIGIQDSPASRRRWRRGVLALLRATKADAMSVYDWALLHQSLHKLSQSEVKSDAA